MTDMKAKEAEWESFWRDLARVRLRSLIVELLTYEMRFPERRLLNPLYQVEAESMVVLLPWEEDLETPGALEDAPFVVVRSPRTDYEST
jgi:hypothetical protein